MKMVDNDYSLEFPTSDDDEMQNKVSPTSEKEPSPSLNDGGGLVGYSVLDDENDYDSQTSDQDKNSESTNDGNKQTLENQDSSFNSSGEIHAVLNEHYQKQRREEQELIAAQEMELREKILDPNFVEIPPEPEESCPYYLQEKVEKAIRRMEVDQSYDPNKAIQDNKAFRNPSIYEKLITFLGIDEKGTNFPPERFNPYQFSEISFYEELAKAQNKEIDRLKSENSKKSELKSSSDKHETVKIKPSVESIDAKDEAHSVFPAAQKKRSKWDNSPHMIENKNPNKSLIPAVGSLVKKK